MMSRMRVFCIQLEGKVRLIHQATLIYARLLECGSVRDGLKMTINRQGIGISMAPAMMIANYA